MKPRVSTAIHTGLIGLGALVMALAGPPLVEHDALDFPVNPLGVNRSPYGEVLAMAMQEPIDNLWHQSAVARQAAAFFGDAAPQPCPPGTVCSHPGCQPRETATTSATRPWNIRLLEFLEKLDEASTARTNRVPPSPGHELHIRRQVENKLRVAYRLDPSHYGNFNSYHFFLTEPAVGTRRILTPAAATLARETIEYSLAEPIDPRPSLTAAAAAINILHIMFADHKSENPSFTVRQMRECLDLLNHAIARHQHLRESWTAAGHDQLLSPMRILEMDERLAFILRIREAAEITVARFEAEK